MQLIQAGKGEALRIRAILRSLVPIEDLVGVISLPVQIPSFGKGNFSFFQQVILAMKFTSDQSLLFFFVLRQQYHRTKDVS